MENVFQNIDYIGNHLQFYLLHWEMVKNKLLFDRGTEKMCKKYQGSFQSLQRHLWKIKSNSLELNHYWANNDCIVIEVIIKVIYEGHKYSIKNVFESKFWVFITKDSFWNFSVHKIIFHFLIKCATWYVLLFEFSWKKVYLKES